MILETIGWFLLSAAIGAVAVAGITAFWDKIRVWLNNSAANAVEKVLGYGARERMHRAVCTIDRAMNVIRNKTVVYTKKNELDTMFDKVTMSGKANPYEIDKDVLAELNKKQVLVQEFGYRQ